MEIASLGNQHYCIGTLSFRRGVVAELCALPSSFWLLHSVTYRAVGLSARSALIDRVE